MLVLVMLYMCFQVSETQQLQVGLYSSTCTNAESIVRQEVERAFSFNRGIAAGLIRLHFHDCFVRGCDGSILIDSTPTNVAEKDSPANGLSLRGLQVIDRAKARLEATCKGIVSCADILAFAARDATELTRGMGWSVPAGRRDGRVSLAAETVDIPPPTFNVDQATQLFVAKGLSQKDMVILLGAHTVGRSHCTSFSDRLYNFSQTTRQDPSLDPNFARFLKVQCPPYRQGNVNPNLVVQMNRSPTLQDNSYYEDILAHRVVFTSDETLNSNSETVALVNEYASNNTDWLVDFAEAMVKMSTIGVLTGPAGEIRSNCRVINP
ncbi:Peroxidase [Heracleum sosnowskyi]|uniref:Peroxidase n=1 Tax=Heracleum sosnowskyi TaxID=360622 RepID=A0AAD8HF77_9APIA|nr:Peroxidase [Heracleum sosnowskyi]